MPATAGRAHTDAVAAAAADVDILVGRGQAPAAGGWQGEAGKSKFQTYVVLYPTPGMYDADLVPLEYFDFTCQFTCVASRQQDAETLADLVKATFVNQVLAVDGRASYRGQLEVDRPVTRDDATAPPLHYAVLQITWRTQPA